MDDMNKSMPKSKRSVEARIFCVLNDVHPNLARGTCINAGTAGRAVVFIQREWTAQHYQAALSRLPWDVNIELGFDGTALVITPAAQDVAA